MHDVYICGGLCTWEKKRKVPEGNQTGTQCLLADHDIDIYSYINFIMFMSIIRITKISVNYYKTLGKV